jgi:hypothetical protein
VQNLIARTTDGVIIFMAVGGLDSIARMSGLMSGSAGGAGFQALRERQNGGEWDSSDPP